MNRVINLCWWNMATGHNWEALSHGKEMQAKGEQVRPLDSWEETMLWQLSTISAPCYKEQSFVLKFVKNKDKDQHGKCWRTALLPGSPLAYSCFPSLVFGLLYRTNSNSTAMQIVVAKYASINITQWKIFGEKGSSPVYLGLAPIF